uniref:Uncharacterized protein n=2 Tax=Amphimedon queenslandica TaxID=400682 RepID=A0A1X7T259_AMPQE
LAELEHTRDELLIQLHQGKDAFVDKNTSLHRYFEPLTALSAALGQQLWLVMRAVPENVVSSPATVVTALRIVQREEKADHYIDDNLRERGIPLSLIPERPKKWREKCVQIMESSINNKFIDIRPQSQSVEENKEWLDDLLTEVATVCYQDLKAMKENGVNCFPPDYDILEMYIKAYHTNLKEVVKELIDRELNARDIIKLMVWVGDVRQSFRDVLEIDLQQYGKLIDDKIEESLEKTCVEQVQWNVSELVKKMIHSEEEEWSATDPPESDNSGCFYTTVGILLYEMIDQNIGALSMLGGNTKELLLHECLKQVSVFQQKYKESVDSKFSSYLSSGRSDPPLYFEYMIAVANNCHSCIEFTERLKSTSEIDMGRLKSEIGKLFGDICEKYKSVSFHCCDILITIMFEDLSPVLDGLMTKEQWLNKPMDLVDKIEGTILDYNSDFERLKQNCRTYVIVQTQQRILRFYFESMMKKKIVLKKKENREKAASFIREESEKLGTLFMRLSHATTPKYTKILKQFAELISSNLDTVPFIIGGLSTNYPEVKFHHVVAVLAMRGDLNKTSVQKLMDRTPLTIESGDQDREMSPTRDSKSILSQISVHNPYALF